VPCLRPSAPTELARGANERIFEYIFKILAAVIIVLFYHDGSQQKSGGGPAKSLKTALQSMLLLQEQA